MLALCAALNDDEGDADAGKPRSVVGAASHRAASGIGGGSGGPLLGVEDVLVEPMRLHGISSATSAPSTATMRGANGMQHAMLVRTATSKKKKKNCPGSI